MKKRSPIPIVMAIFAALFICVTVCCAAQAAARYIDGQEKKNTLIVSVGENVDVLRSCLQPASSFSQVDIAAPADSKKISEIVPSAGAISIPTNSKCTAIAPPPRDEIDRRSASE